MRFSAAAVLATVALLAGCTTVPVSTPTSAPVAVPAPDQLFGGDCDALFSDDGLSTALGQPVAATAVSAGVHPGRLLVEESGGIRCGWSTDDFSTIVYVVAVPAAAVDVGEVTSCGPITGGAESCTVDATSNGARLSGIVATTGGDEAVLLGQVAGVEALFATAAAGSAPVPVPTPANGAWATPADCASVEAAVDFAAMFRVADSFTARDGASTDFYVPPVEAALWGSHATTTCSIASDNPDAFYGIDFAVLGGGGWALDEVSAQPGAHVVDVDGLDTVIETPGADLTTIDVFDGVNWLQTFAADPQAMYPMIAAIVGTLNGAAA